MSTKTLQENWKNMWNMKVTVIQIILKWSVWVDIEIRGSIKTIQVAALLTWTNVCAVYVT